MKWGESVQFLETVAEETGRLPTALQERPALDAHLILYAEAFGVLNQCRTGGFGPNPISLSDIRAYCALHEINEEEETRLFVKYIKAMDMAFLKFCSEKKK